MAFRADYNRVCSLTINCNKVGGNVEFFPALLCYNLVGSETILPDEMLDPGATYHAQADGGDIRFTSDALGLNELQYEIEIWTPHATKASRKAKIWVKIPAINASRNTVIYVWYNSDVTEYYPFTKTIENKALAKSYTVSGTIYYYDTVKLTDGLIAQTPNDTTRSIYFDGDPLTYSDIIIDLSDDIYPTYFRFSYTIDGTSNILSFYQVNLYFSNDGINWTNNGNVWSRGDGTSWTTTGDGIYWTSNLTFPSVHINQTWRYIKIIVTPNAETGKYYSMSEIEIYGYKYMINPVWSGYKEVYHLSETATPSYSANKVNSMDWDGTGNSGTAGKIGIALTLNGSGYATAINQWDSYASLDRHSYSLWINQASAHDSFVVNNGYQNGTCVAIKDYTGRKFCFFRGQGTTDVVHGNTTISNGTWYHVVMANNGDGTVAIYINGVAETLTYVNAWSFLYDAVHASRVGTNNVANAPFYGSVQEIRICPKILTQSFVTSEYNNQNDPATFFTVGTPGAPPEIDALFNQLRWTVKLVHKTGGAKKTWFLGQDECPISNLVFENNLLGCGSATVTMEKITLPLDADDQFIIEYYGQAKYRGLIDITPDPKGGEIKIIPVWQTLDEILYTKTFTDNFIDYIVQTLIDSYQAETGVIYNPELVDLTDALAFGRITKEYKNNTVKKILDDIISSYTVNCFWGVDQNNYFYVKRYSGGPNNDNTVPDKTLFYTDDPAYSEIEVVKDNSTVAATRYQVYKKASSGYYSTGTASCSTKAVTGTGTYWKSAASFNGGQIGFGTTDPTAVSTWYDIFSVNSDTGITLMTSAGSLGAAAYVIKMASSGGTILCIDDNGASGVGYGDRTVSGVTYHYPTLPIEILLRKKEKILNVPDTIVRTVDAFEYAYSLLQTMAITINITARDVDLLKWEPEIGEFVMVQDREYDVMNTIVDCETTSGNDYTFLNSDNTPTIDATKYVEGAASLNYVFSAHGANIDGLVLDFGTAGYPETNRWKMKKIGFMYYITGTIYNFDVKIDLGQVPTSHETFTKTVTPSGPGAWYYFEYNVPEGYTYLTKINIFVDQPLNINIDRVQTFQTFKTEYSDNVVQINYNISPDVENIDTKLHSYDLAANTELYNLTNKYNAIEKIIEIARPV